MSRSILGDRRGVPAKPPRRVESTQFMPSAIIAAGQCLGCVKRTVFIP